MSFSSVADAAISLPALPDAVTAQLNFHRQHGKSATVTAVQPPGRYGALLRSGDAVRGFQEKPPGDGAWINGGFFVLNPSVIDFIEDVLIAHDIYVSKKQAYERASGLFETLGLSPEVLQKYPVELSGGELAHNQLLRVELDEPGGAECLFDCRIARQGLPSRSKTSAAARAKSACSASESLAAS